ncbi:MAG TPA: hypothetical protein DC049_15480 [Spirochaetia bacterium]|nr:hypothetical protein [Spirochaetia bacterium]
MKKKLINTGAPSYIIESTANHLLDNVRYLSDLMDCTQLLCFGRNYYNEVFNTKSIEELKAVQNETGLRYLVHLPADLALLTPSRSKEATDCLQKIFSLTSVLSVEYYILHLDGFKTSSEHYLKTLIKLRQKFPENFKNICIENHDAAEEKKMNMAIQNGFPLCLDTGHCFISGQNPLDFYTAFAPHIKVLHIHGHNRQSDHLPLSILQPEEIDILKKILVIFKGITVIEVFNEGDLEKSLDTLRAFSLPV